jgi:hypothetical protein
LASGALLSCVSIDGGAVETSWVIRTEDGRAISSCGCADPPIARVRVKIVKVDGEGRRGEDVCAGKPGCEFPCGRHIGATPFDVPPGSYSVSVVPLGEGGVDLTMAGDGRPAVVLAPLLYDVVRGQPTQVESFLIVSRCAAACAGADSNKVCSRD